MDEAYARNLSSLDTGAAQRVLRNLSACFLIAKLFNVVNAVDIGGGDGLLCRFLRDYGINCFVTDKYAAHTYAQGFDEPDFTVPDMVMAFEILEHLRHPMTELDAIFATGAEVVLASTTIYRNQTQDWWYLVPDGGQHVFFYSLDALALIANRYERRLTVVGDFMLFTKRRPRDLWKRLMARVLLNKYVSRLARCIIVLLPTPGVWRDHARMKRQG